MNQGESFGKVPNNRIDNFGEDLQKHLYRGLRRKTIVGVYDFSKQGGTVSTTFNFQCEWDETKDLVLPKGAIILNAMTWTDTAITTGSSGKISYGTGSTAGGVANLRAAAVPGATEALNVLGSTLFNIWGTANTNAVVVVSEILDKDSTPAIATTVGPITAGRVRMIFDVILP